MWKNLICVTAVGLLLGVTAGVARAEIIAYWPFEEGVGDTATDVVGQIQAKMTGIDWVAGKVGSFAVQSSGGSDSILVSPGGPVTPTTKDLSIAWWMVDTYGSYHGLMNKSTDSSQAGYSILLRPTSEPSPIIFRIGGFQAYGGWGVECAAPAGAYKDNEWVHVVCTFDSGSDTAKIYINGVLPPNGNNNPKTGIAGPGGYCQGVNDAAQPLYIVGQRETFQGIVDEVAIWDNALTADSVAKVYALGPLALDPRLANSPKPADGATEVRREAILEWTAGESATAHDVYLGTVFEDVNAADATSPLLVSRGQTGTTYDPPGRLEFGTTYYWRVDEVGAATLKGATWKFTTELVSYPVALASITATSSSNEANQGPVNTVNSSGLAKDLHSEELTAMWLTAQDANGPAWIQYQFDRVLRLDEMWVWNHNGLLEPMLGLGAKEVKIEYSTDGNDFKVLGTTHEFARAPGTAGHAVDTIVDLQGIAARFVKLTIKSNWGNVLQQSGLSEVRFYSVPVFSREPSPTNSKTAVDVDSSLSWRAGREAAKHVLYVSTDQQAVTDGTAPAQTVTTPASAPALNLATTYFWRVDEVNDAQTPALWQGAVWTFSTEDFDVVDDFESYTNDSPKRVFQAWIDGAGFSADEFFPQGNKGNGTGSLVGYDPTLGQIVETATVHAGARAMPLFYDNTSATYSETTRTFASPQNWTEHGIKGLTLWFYGNATNDTQQMYVKINNAKILYDGEATNLKMPGWRMWYISLAGQSVSSVTSISIGFDKLGGAGGKGKVLIDDLRLYLRDRQLVTPKVPDNVGLQAQYLFEGNTTDSSGKGRNGSLKGAPTYVAGKVGQAISLDGFDDSVNIDGYKGILADAAGVQQAFTVCAWIKTAVNARDIIAWGTNVGGQRMNFRVDTVLRLEHGGGNMRGTNGPSLLDNEWHHVAATVPLGGKLPDTRLYVDGVDVSAPASATAAYNLKANVDVAIGMGGSIATGRFFQGLIDDVRIYDRALSAEEIAGMAGKTLPFDKSF